MTFDDHLARTLFKRVERRPAGAPKPVPLLLMEWDADSGALDGAGAGSEGAALGWVRAEVKTRQGGS